MRLLADENFPRPVVHALRQNGLDVLWVAEVSAGIADEAVVALCAAERRTLLTFDKDFGDLAFRRGLAADAGVILFRNAQCPPAEIVASALAVFRMRQDFARVFAVVTSRGVRIRSLGA